MARVFAFLLALGLAASAHAAPRHVTARYDLVRDGQPFGTVQETFDRANGDYRLESVTRATGVYAVFVKGEIRLTSTGKVTSAGLRPLRFEDRRGNPDKTAVAEFDWDGMTLSLTHDGKSEAVPLSPGTLDRISLLYQFMFAPPEKEEILLPMTTGRKLNLYRYRVAGEETVTTPAGRFQTIRLVKQRTGDEDGTEVWLAKERHHFPVKIVIEERNGARLEQQLTGLAFDSR